MGMTSLFVTTALCLLTVIQTKELDLTDDKEWLLNLNLNPVAQPQFKIFLFNFSNPEEFLEGEKPILNEVGPYVYKEKFVRDDLKWLSDGRVSYVPKRIYKFFPKASRPNRQIDKITTVNIPMITALHQLRIGTQAQRNTINSLLDVLKQKSYQTLLVRHLIWGTKNPLIKLGRDIKPKSDPTRYPYEKYGIFVGRNFTDQGKLTEATGLVEDDGYLGEIQAWNDKPEWGLWRKGSDCDKARGSYGIFFKPQLSKEDRIYLYRKDFCRSIPMDFERTIEDDTYGGLTAYRFAPPKNLLEAPSAENNENLCFCKAGSCGDVPSGTFNISLCSYGAPILLSRPHFLYADEELKDAVEGLNPDAEKHESYIDIEPVTGMTLGVRAGLQMNVKISPDESVSQAKGLRDFVFPLAYFMDEIKLEDEATIERLKKIVAGA